jgi:hypothetical protein
MNVARVERSETRGITGASRIPGFAALYPGYEATADLSTNYFKYKTIRVVR